MSTAINYINHERIFPKKINLPQKDIVAIGSNLQVESLLNAYKQGVFPWYEEGEPILWWSPLNRAVIPCSKVHISKSMRSLIKKCNWEFKIDKNFKKVIEYCASIREKSGTWLSEDMINAYVELHKLGYAHSFEIYSDNNLIGGLYGVSNGLSFCGESMFSLTPNSSKFALIMMDKVLSYLNFSFIDCQIMTPHLQRMGALAMKRKEFIDILNKSDINKHKEKWTKYSDIILNSN